MAFSLNLNSKPEGPYHSAAKPGEGGQVDGLTVVNPLEVHADVRLRTAVDIHHPAGYTLPAAITIGVEDSAGHGNGGTFQLN